MDKITIEKCRCGDKSCKDYWLVGIGTFVQGSGFRQDEAELIAGLLNTHGQVLMLSIARDRRRHSVKEVIVSEKITAREFADRLGALCTLARASGFAPELIMRGLIAASGASSKLGHAEGSLIALIANIDERLEKEQCASDSTK
jgi:hypothetical protein